MHHADLDGLLDQTYRALLSGDLRGLARLTADMETTPDIRVADRAAAERLRSKAERNQRLLRAAAQGVRTARGRLVEISAEPALTTYDAKGHKASVGQVAPGQPRRF
ncbi:hypothetical protein [Tabrizicola sp. BL-A-41-H6]|uniref:hypothetical protein n=1 Tax=Tabrizicola sp. BL-A-41-H6 TaxID=3421107 RepID=UPI003D6678D1